MFHPFPFPSPESLHTQICIWGVCIASEQSTLAYHICQYTHIHTMYVCMHIYKYMYSTQWRVFARIHIYTPGTCSSFGFSARVQCSAKKHKGISVIDAGLATKIRYPHGIRETSPKAARKKTKWKQTGQKLSKKRFGMSKDSAFV